MKKQLVGDCRRLLEFIFDVDDTERLSVEFFENYEGEFNCELVVGNARFNRADFNVPSGYLPDFSLAVRAANEWLRFNRLTPKGIESL